MANGPGGKSAGRVSIRVVPDSTQFKVDLKKSLDRIEKSTVVSIPLAIETRQAEVDLRKFAKKWNGEAISFDVDAKTLGAATHLKEFTHRRSIDVAVNISKASIAKAATILASLSGARVAGDLVKNVSSSLQNLDRSLPRIAAISLAVGAIGSMALSSVGGLATLAVSLTGILGLAGPLPGIIGAAGAGALILGIALSTAKTQLVSLTPVWASLKKIVTDNFWAQAKKPIIDFVQSTLPQLKGALPGVSSALGSWAASVTNGFKNAFGNEVLAGMLGKLRQSIDIAATGTGGFASAIAQLGTFGASFLPRLAQWFADLSNQFGAWVSKVVADGSLDRWAAAGIAVAKQLFDVLGSGLRIIAGVANAASAAGSGGLATFADFMSRIADIINSPAFQSTLTTLFAGAAAGVSGLALALGPIGDMFTALAPTIAAVLGSIGTTLGTTLAAIASALSSPAVASGLSALFQGLMTGIVAIQPALPAVAAALGSVATFAGALAAQLGPILGAALSALAPVVIALLTALQPLIPVLGTLLLAAITGVAPILQMLAGVVAQLVPVIMPIIQALMPLVGAILPVLSAILQTLVPIIMLVATAFAQIATILLPIVQALMPPLLALFQALMPIISAVLTALVPIIMLVATAFAQIATALMPIISSIMPPLLALFQALMPTIMAVVQAVMALLTPIIGLITPLLQLIGPILGPLIGLFATLIGVALKPMLPLIQALVPIFGAVGRVIGDVLLPVIKLITDVLGGLITFITGVFTGNWKKAWAGIVQIFSGIWNGIVGIGKATINGVVDLINGLIGGVNNITGAIGIPKIPKIPRLAIGADIEPRFGGTAVILGEGGHKETVTDFGKTNRLIDAANALSMRAMGVEGPAGSASGLHIDQVNIRTDDDPRLWARGVGDELSDLMSGVRK